MPKSAFGILWVTPHNALSETWLGKVAARSSNRIKTKQQSADEKRKPRHMSGLHRSSEHHQMNILTPSCQDRTCTHQLGSRFPHSGNLFGTNHLSPLAKWHGTGQVVEALEVKEGALAVLGPPLS